MSVKPYDSLERHEQRLVPFDHHRWGAPHFVKSANGQAGGVPVGINLRDSSTWHEDREGINRTVIDGQNHMGCLGHRWSVLIVATSVTDNVLRLYREAQVFRKDTDDQVHVSLEQIDYSQYGFHKLNNTWYDPNNAEGKRFAEIRFAFGTGFRYWWGEIFKD